MKKRTTTKRKRVLIVPDGVQFRRAGPVAGYSIVVRMPDGKRVTVGWGLTIGSARYVAASIRRALK